MKIIAGLGNPGAEYAKTKHNVGFMFIDALADALGLSASDWKDKFEAKVADARIGAQKVVLVKPQTYMNESGRAVGPLMNWYKLAPEDLIVVHDDMDIPAGTIRIRKKGSAGGHNGIKSILAHVGDEHFARVRIGIGRPLPGRRNVVVSRDAGYVAEGAEVVTSLPAEIDGWVIDALKACGCDTAKSVLELPVEEIAARADLELEQAQKVVEILKAEFEE